MSMNSYRDHEHCRIFFLRHAQQRRAMMNLAEALETPHERRVLLFLRNRLRPLNLGEISHTCRLQEQDARTILAILMSKGLVRRVGNGLFVSP